MATSFGEDLRRLILAGIGSVALTLEKSKDLIDELVAKGELTVEQGKVLNEELKRNIKESMDKKVSVTINREEPVSSIIDRLDQLNPEEMAILKEKLSALEKKDPEDGAAQ